MVSSCGWLEWGCDPSPVHSARRSARHSWRLQPGSNGLQPSSFLLLVGQEPLVASLLLVAMPFPLSSFLLLVVMASFLPLGFASLLRPAGVDDHFATCLELGTWADRPARVSLACWQKLCWLACSLQIGVFIFQEPFLLGWRSSLLGWRPWLVGWKPLLLGWRSSPAMDGASSSSKFP